MIDDFKNLNRSDFTKKSLSFLKCQFLKLFSNRIIHYKNHLNNKFIFQKKSLKYFFHKYNLTWCNERAVEIPIVIDHLNSNKPKDILEIGAVLYHYVKADWDIVDLFEKGTGIINKDITTYITTKKYDFIFSISTLEHIGKDDVVRPEKVTFAIQNIKKLLKKGGTIITTVPVGYNSYLDKLIFNNKLDLGSTYFLKKINNQNEWKQVNLTEVKKSAYGQPYPNANAIAVSIYN